MESQPAGRKPRRSRLEMLGDILEAVSRGIRQPTRIMQVVNLTWNDLLVLTEALMRNGLLVREESTKEFTLTARGKGVLDAYSSLKEGLGQAEADTLSTSGMAKALKHPVAGRGNLPVLEALRARLSAAGLNPIPGHVKGVSGTTHPLDLVVRGKDGSKRGYVVLGDVSENQVLGLFTVQFDTGISVRAVYSGAVSPGARQLAERYAVRLEKWTDQSESREGPGQELNLFAYSGKKVLLEVDPTLRYETSVSRMVSAFIREGEDVCVFTWKGSPIYEDVSSKNGLKLYTMTSAVAYTKQVGSTNEFLVPQGDQAVLLEEMRKLVESHRKPHTMIVFDSISDLIVLIGFEHTFGFLREMGELLSGSTVTTFSILKHHSHDEKTDNLIKGLFNEHLVYGGSGLSVAR